MGIWNFLLKLFVRPVEPRPAKIVSPWPEGEQIVKVLLWEDMGKYPRGSRLTLAQEAFARGTEPRYLVLKCVPALPKPVGGEKVAKKARIESWPQSVLAEAVENGQMAVLPSGAYKSAL